MTLMQGIGVLALVWLALSLLVVALCVSECVAQERAQPTREYDPLARDHYQQNALAAARKERWG